MNINVRPARQADFERFLDLYLGRFEPEQSGKADRDRNDPVIKLRSDQARRVLDPVDRATTLVAESDVRDLTGYITLSIHEPGPAPIEGSVSTGKIDEFYVAADYRDSGSGNMLMNAADAWFRSRNVFRITVTAFARDEDTITYYHQLGYRISDVLLTKWL